MLSIVLQVSLICVILLAPFFIEFHLISNLIELSSGYKYWLGVSGGSAMLLSLLYPLRKYFWEEQGKLRIWLNLHLIIGLAGTLLISAHGNLKLQAVIPAAAYGMMILLAVTGIISRFLLSKISEESFELELLGKKEELDDERSGELTLLTSLYNKLAMCRIIHFSAAASMIGLVVGHVVSVHYTRGMY